MNTAAYFAVPPRHFGASTKVHWVPTLTNSRVGCRNNAIRALQVEELFAPLRTGAAGSRVVASPLGMSMQNCLIDILRIAWAMEPSVEMIAGH